MKLTDLLEAPLSDDDEKLYLKSFISVAKKSDHWDSKEALLDKLSRPLRDITGSGTKMLGSGLFGEVYGKEGNDVVVKLAVRDPQTVKWVKWVLRNQDNKHVPKIYGFKSYRDSIYVRMERLIPVPKKFDWVKNAPDLVIALADADYTTVGEPIIIAVINSFGKQQLDNHFDFDNLRDAIKALPKSLTKSPLAKLVSKISYMNNDLIDVAINDDGTAQNIMLRPGTHDVVITDPVSS